MSLEPVRLWTTPFSHVLPDNPTQRAYEDDDAALYALFTALDDTHRLQNPAWWSLVSQQSVLDLWRVTFYNVGLTSLTVPRPSGLSPQIDPTGDVYWIVNYDRVLEESVYWLPSGLCGLDAAEGVVA